MRSRKNAVPVPVTRDLLQEKQTEVARLARQASEAVDIVTRTMNELEGINQQIDNDLAEIDTYSNWPRHAPPCPSSGRTIPLSSPTSQSSWIPVPQRA